MAKEKKAPIRNWDRLPDSPNCVTIFGAGIAGLTAAHELVERGFQVQVWERQENQRNPEKGCDVGGLARTQWSAVRWPESRDVDHLPNQRLPFAKRRTRTISHIRQLLYLTWSPGVFVNLTSPTIRGGTRDALSRVLGELRQKRAASGKFRIRVRCYLLREMLEQLREHPSKLAERISEVFGVQRSPQGKLDEAHDFFLEGELEGMEFEFSLMESPNSDWPPFIIDVVGEHGKQLEPEVHVWASPTEIFTGGGLPNLSRSSTPPPELGYYRILQPQTNLFGVLPQAIKDSIQKNEVSPPEKVPKCSVKIYDTSAAGLTATEFERRGGRVSRKLQEVLLEQMKVLRPEVLSISPFALVPRPTFGAMELAFDVVRGEQILFCLEVQLLHSRRPDWTDISIQWEEQDPVHIRRLWSLQLEQIHVTLPEESDFRRHAYSVGGTTGHAALAGLEQKLREAAWQTDVVYVEITSRQVGQLSEAEKDRRVDLVRRLIESKLERIYQGKIDYRWIDDFPYSPGDQLPPEVEVVVAFRPRERWLPGEHGYRFFPSFYHHLFDTMKRTPLLEVEEKSQQMLAQERSAGISLPEPVQYVESGRTAFDNLQPTSSYVLASAKAQRASQLSRFPFTSLEEAREYLQIVFGPREAGGFGFSPRDAGRLVLKVLQFATSCEQRRKEYENLSWWDYLDGDSFSPNAQYLLQRLPEALVAMDAHESDARTQWVPFIQILLDQVRMDRYRDGTLRGPTTEAWLVPWRRYLEAQGVEFIRGELEGFDLIEVNGERRLHPRVFCFEPRYSPDLANPPLRPGYFILAVSAEEARRLGEEYSALKKREGLSSDAKECAYEDESDLHAASRLGGDMTLQELDEELHQPRPNSDFRHFAGLQYYFAEDVFWIDGHVYYPDSPWAITSISQARFWQEKMDWEHGYRGILSAIIGAWDIESPALGKTAWECTEEELAEEVWRQIREGIQSKHARSDTGTGRFARRTPSAGALPEPLYWHLDQGVSVERKRDGKVSGYRNRTPFLIATPGRFSERPGALEGGHTVEHGFVLAGYYTQTYTRIPSMEAANESARRAVNAILRHLELKAAPGHQYRRAYCDIWNPEDREVDDFRLLKELDGHLCTRGNTHVMEILDLDDLTANLLRGGKLDPLDPLRILSRLTRLHRKH